MTVLLWAIPFDFEFIPVPTCIWIALGPNAISYETAKPFVQCVARLWDIFG